MPKKIPKLNIPDVYSVGRKMTERRKKEYYISHYCVVEGEGTIEHSVIAESPEQALQIANARKRQIANQIEKHINPINIDNREIYLHIGYISIDRVDDAEKHDIDYEG